MPHVPDRGQAAGRPPAVPPSQVASPVTTGGAPHHGSSQAAWWLAPAGVVPRVVARGTRAGKRGPGGGYARSYRSRLDTLTHAATKSATNFSFRSEEHTSELQSHSDLVCRLLLEKKKKNRDE